jgi:PAS domain S-box-containing protein
MGSIDSKKSGPEGIPPELARYIQDLDRARVFLQAILDGSEDMILTTDLEGSVSTFSSGGEKLLGYSLADVQGRALRSLAAQPEKFDRIYSECRERSGPVRAELVFFHKDGRPVHLDVSLIAPQEPDSQGVGAVGICRDMTRLKQLRENLIQIDRLAEIGRITAGVAHEINNPIAIIGEIVGWVETVVGDAKGLGKEDRDELETAVKHLIEQTKRCKAITTQLLGFARDAAPTLTLVDLDALLKDVVSFLRPELKYAPIEVEVSVDPAAAAVRSDPKKLQQVFVNLLTNAIHAIKEKKTDQGSIVVKASKAGQHIEVGIADNGTGIPEAYRKRAFELFATTKPPGKGTGLGLPICRDILEKLGGEIDFKSQPGVGTTFTVRLPVS